MTDSSRALTEVRGIPEFWQKVRVAPHRSLVLDYDGTIAEFCTDRMRALPLEGVVDLLVGIRDETETYLAMMTGRPLSELLELLGDLGIPMSGSQGTEFRSADGTYEARLPTDEQKKRLDRAEAEARSACPNATLERKIAGIALHTRGMAPEEARREERMVHHLWSVDVDEYDLECRRFNGGVELRLRGVDKGTALVRLLQGQPEDSLCVYAGDDNTDEDAFEVVRERGFGIRVGETQAETAALGQLKNPPAVREFLRSWLTITRRE